MPANSTQTHKFKIPLPGARILKTAIAVAICFIIYDLFRDDGLLFYSQIAAIFCVQPLRESTKKSAISRASGTVVGAVFGLITILIQVYVLKDLSNNEYIIQLLIVLMEIALLYFIKVSGMKTAGFFSSVVFMSIAINHIGDANPYLFVFNRFLDTMIGIAVGTGVNMIHLPHKINQKVLYVSGLDNTLLMDGGKLSDYSVIELNRMISDGLQFTISTRRTVASLKEPLKGIKLNLPVIAMDGAVLYDLQKNEYLKAYVISPELTAKLRVHLNQFDCNYFMNMLIGDTLLIQYKELKNEAEIDLYNKMHTSPYRNYTTENIQSRSNCIYFMVLDKPEKVHEIAEYVRALPFADQLKIDMYADPNHAGYMYLKIYNHNATRANMLAYLKEMLDVEEIITFGSIEGMFDVRIEDRDPDLLVQTLKKLQKSK